ncbi:neuraminidase-like domain-containing protein [Pseudomonas sp. ICMP 561]|uniref:Tc toxin subunit A-related protein n=1 Tax=Pseudomonas sp. ICMP 561 TaxID=1718918 RepID=UPI000C069D61|nr:neuraminidase-like domain-containing protein [Pseudomonas sp. ICMP 561]PHN17635.1 toxin [Pseudomonas sp. ICMP 561]
MSRSIESQLNESYRDALVEYYLSEVVPNSPELISLGLNTRLKTANDLYEFFLLDNQVSHDVQTSPVASAISSLQQYINGALLGMEPGYDLLRPDEARFVEWRDRSSQYPIWAANMRLALYPEVYISPALRLKKSSYFAQLENDINQNKINSDTTQEAVKSYLASFEEVANLTIINGYIDSDRFAEGKYYFLGKSRAEQVYYWRMVDMNERAYTAGSESPKHDNPTPGAWSDWKRANIGVNACTLERTIRPIYFNNRLFISWVDAADAVALPSVEGTDEAPVVSTTDQIYLSFYLSYKKYDDSWSAPQEYMQVTTTNTFTRAGKTVDLKKDLNTIAVFDASASPESLFIAMYAGETLVGTDADGSTSTYAYLATAFIDKNFNTTKAFPSAGYIDKPYDFDDPAADEARIRKTCWALALKNKENFQFTWNIHIGIKTLITTAPQPNHPSWNYGGWQSRITERLTADMNHESSTLMLTTSLRNDFQLEDTTLRFTTNSSGRNTNIDFLLKFKYNDQNYFTLKNDSHLKIQSPPSTFGNECYFSLNRSTDKKTNGELFDYLLNTYSRNYDIPDGEGIGSIRMFDLENGKLRRGVVDALTGKISDIPPSEITYATSLSLSNPLPVVYTFTNLEIEPGKKFNQHFSYPQLMQAPSGTQEDLAKSQTMDSLLAPSSYTISIPIDKSTLRPRLKNTLFIDDSRKFYISHGVIVLDQSSDSWLGTATLSTEIELTWETEGSDPIAPKISKRTDPLLGIAEYIDFSGSSIQYSDGSASNKRDPIRMNTLFARELINKANIALEALLSWNTQQLQEPPIGEEAESSKMDFKGANGLYFWELFLHLPFMVSHRLNLEQQFNEAEQWLGFIFDPGRKARDSAPAYWNVRPLVEVSDPDYFMRAPIDPDGIAASDPVRYQKAVYFHYIKNLIDRGDMAYRQLTPDSLGEAKLWYVRILDLLGPRPDTVLVSRWEQAPLQELATSTSTPLREFASRLEQQEEQVRSSARANNGKSLISFSDPPLRLSTFASDPTLAEEDNDRFITPMNAELVKYWDMLESRLYNLRHNLTLDGKPLSLPLFAAPLDPRALLAAYANGATGGGAGSLLAQEVPHYRYAVMYARASAAVDTLIQFGATLLSIIERKEQSQLLELQQVQAWEFAQFAIDLQLEAQKVEVEARKALLASKAIADARANFYGDLADENVSGVEILAGVYHLIARVAEGTAAVANIVGAAIKPVPTDVGVHAGATGGMAVGAAGGAAIGGSRFDGIPELVAIGAQIVATTSESMSFALDRTETFRRRLQEWENSRDQAKLESDHITAQLAVHDAQAQVTRLQLRQAEKARTQAQDVYAFLNKRFTNSQLYSWLNGQFSTFYYQAYDATLSLCLATQACWQYEIGDYTTHFIQPGAWKDAYRGLAAGESLKLNLLRMDAAYLTRNERRLEIVKTISLKQLAAENDTLNNGWDMVVERLAEEGIAELEITQAMLDADYPGHYLRRIKRISLSLPVTVGPYQDIHATLTQSYNAVQMSAQADGPLKENMRASQQIAVSTGVDDDGLFTFNFDDERYLPFEGTGAISRWALTFSNPESQRDMIDSITDIIVHMRYTAKSGGLH